jgi:hypothetical protein
MSKNKEAIISKLTKGIPLGINKDYITAAQLKTIELDGHRETIDINTVLISKYLTSKIRPSHTNPVVNKSGIQYSEEYQFNPKFWIYVSPTSGLKKAEPLVLSWCTGNHTTFCIDHGFLSTFNLAPRLLNDEIIWDDLTVPDYEIVKNKPLSVYDFPHQTEAFVQIKTDYLKDYLFLRKKSAIQIYNIKKDIVVDEDIVELLDHRGVFIEEFDNFEIRIKKFDHKNNIARLEINGFSIIADYFQDNSKEETVGHYWKGINGLVTAMRASQMAHQYVYVSDTVLSKYEDNDSYDLHPNTGSVSYMSHWGISYCERVGKNAIKLEIKKLYEGGCYTEIDYWNKFSISKDEIIDGVNIVDRAELLTKKYFLFSRLFCQLINSLFDFQFVPSDIITLDEDTIYYTGWSEFEDYKPLTNHLDYNSFSKDQFLRRCKKIHILICENLKEKPLRMIVNKMGFAKDDTRNFRSIKLLDLIFKYLHISQNTGLSPTANEEIIERLIELKDFSFIQELFALNDIRQLDAHKTPESNSKLNFALTNLNIHPNSIANNYAVACESVYDSLDEMFFEINNFLCNYQI